jgi:ATP-dependent DNA ligase
MEFTMPAEIGNYLPLEVKLNIVLEVAFNSSQPGMRHAGGLPLRFPRIKAVRRDKNVHSVDTL